MRGRRRWTPGATLALACLAPAIVAADEVGGERQAIVALIEQADAFSSQQQRRADRAWPLATAALRRAETLGDPALVSRAARATARALLQMDRVDEAQAMLERAAREARAAGDPLLATEALRWQGNLLAGKSAFGEAEAVLREALEMARRGGDVIAEANALNSLGVNARHRGAARDYLGLARRALELLDSERAAGRELPDTLAFAIPFNVGRALAMSGDYAAAAEYFDRAFESAHATGHRGGQWHALHETGEWYARQGDTWRARRYFGRAYEVSLTLDARDMEARSLHGLAETAAVQGELGEALERFEEACGLYEKIQNTSFLPRCRAEQARVLARMGELSAARLLVDETLAVSRQSDHRTGIALGLLESGRIELASARPDAAVTAFARALDLAREAGLRALEAPGLVGLARAEAARGRSGRASELLQEAIGAIESTRSRVPSSDLRAAFDEARQDAFGLLFHQLLQRHAEAPEAGFDAEALLLLERQRGQSLADAVSVAGVSRRRDLPPEAREALRSAEQRVATLQLQLAEASAAPASWSAPQSVAALRRALLPGEAAIVYPADDTPVAFVVTAGAFRMVSLVPLPDLGARQGLFVRLLLSPSPERAVPVGRALAESLLSPALAALPEGVSRLVVVASGPAAQAPLGALPDPSAPQRPMLARLPVSYVPSLALLGHLRSAGPSAARGVLAVAAPGRRVPDALSEGGQALPPLPRAEAEVRHVSASAPDATLLVGPDASEARLRELPLGSFRLLHFATHALLDPAVPQRSAIVLAASGHQDGLLQQREIFELEVDADLVVLNACGSASGRLSAAAGMRSLARAFLYAGARSVLGAQWRIADGAAERLARRFYAELAAGSPAAAALSRAQVHVAGDDAWATAADWAGYVLVGDPGVSDVAVVPLEASSPATRARLAGWLGAALVVGLLVGVITRLRSA